MRKPGESSLVWMVVVEGDDGTEVEFYETRRDAERAGAEAETEEDVKEVWVARLEKQAGPPMGQP